MDGGHEKGNFALEKVIWCSFREGKNADVFIAQRLTQVKLKALCARTVEKSVTREYGRW